MKVNQLNIESVLSVRDKTGLKVSNVFFYRKKQNEKPQWTQILPTPIFGKIDEDDKLEAGGILEHQRIFLKAIPRSKFTKSDLQTSSLLGNEERYWVINKIPFTTFKIIMNLLTWDVLIERYDAINELTPPN